MASKNPHSDNSKLIQRIERVEGEILLLRDELSCAQRELDRKDQIIAGLQKMLFGKKSERYNPNQYQLEFGADVMGKLEPELSGEQQDEKIDSSKTKPKQTRRKKSDLFPKNIAVKVVARIKPDEVNADPEKYIKIGEEYHDELEVKKSELYYQRTVLEKFKEKGQRDKAPISPPAPHPSIPGTMCGPELMAMILVDKYCDHLPQYRQADRFLRRHGVVLCRQTINKWTHYSARYLEVIGEAIKKEIAEASVLQVDETPMYYLDPGAGERQRGYLWYYRNLESGAVYCDWQLGRGHECLLDMLGYDEISGTISFSGTIQCDGYSAYQALERRFGNINLAGCLAHIRRKFIESFEQAPEVVGPILQIIQELYTYERGLRNANAPPPCRELVRGGYSRPLVKELKEKILDERIKHLPQSKLGEALNYALNQWEEFELYLEDGRLEIDNNLIENAIRPAKLGLKNYLFFGSAEAGKSSALMYTLMANCKALGIDPERYLVEAIKAMTADTTVEQAAELTPAKLAAKIRSQQPVPLALEAENATKDKAA